MLFTQDQVNLHTHSFYCRHGTGTIDQYVDSAKAAGLRVLGFSEHCPLPDRIFPPTSRMDYDQLPLYEADVQKAAKENNIRILLGAECDWLEDEASFYRDELLGARGYDYLICSIHFMKDPNTGKDRYIGKFGDCFRPYLSAYVYQYTQALSSGMFLFGCHPDLFLGGYTSWDNNTKAASVDIISCAIENNIPLEVNDYGLRKEPIITDTGLRHPYTVREFWELARDMGAKIVTNSDAHRPQDIFPARSFEFAQSLGIEYCNWKVDGSSISVC